MSEQNVSDPILKLGGHCLTGLTSSESFGQWCIRPIPGELEIFHCHMGSSMFFIQYMGNGNPCFRGTVTLTYVNRNCC